MPRRFHFFIALFAISLFTVNAWATHQEEGLVEVERDIAGKETVKEAPVPELQAQPEGIEGKKLKKTTEARLEELEKKMRVFEATTITREEATGHIFNYFEGFEFRFGITGIAQGSFNNQDNNTATVNAENSLDASGSMDLVIARQFFNHGLGLVHLEGGVGNGLNQNPVFNALLFGVVNRDATPQAARVEVAEAYYEGNYLDGAFVFSLGRLDPTVYFDNNAIANDDTTQFLNGGFKNNTAVEFPAYSFGAQITGMPCEWFYVGGGVFDASTTGYDVEDNVFWILETGFIPKIGGLKGHYRLYGWQNRSDHTDLNNGRTNDYGLGIGASIDQMLTKWLVLFARAGYRSPSIYQVKMAFSGGLALLGNLYDRKNDWMGIAYGIAINNDKFVAGRNEHVIEWFYRFSVGKGHVGISPDVQFIINPSGAYGTHNVVAAGIRAQVDF